jgi:hypothetical protein
MIIHPRHPIRATIDDTYYFLSSMIERFPSLLNDWMAEQEQEVGTFAKEFSEGDPEVYLSTYQSQIQRIDPCYYEIELFNQSMLIMTYSYYESTIYRFAKETESDNRPSCIAEKEGSSLDEVSLKISSYLFDTIRPLRNELCHNNNGTLFIEATESEKSNILELVRKGILSINDEKIIISDSSFILQTLEIEHKLLCNLADICGYK